MPVERAPRKPAKANAYNRNQGKRWAVVRAPRTIKSHPSHSRIVVKTSTRGAPARDDGAVSSASSTDMPDAVDTDVELASAPGSPTVANEVIQPSVVSPAVADAGCAVYVSIPRASLRHSRVPQRRQNLSMTSMGGCGQRSGVVHLQTSGNCL